MSVTKAWVGGTERPDVTVHLLADGADTGQSATLNAANDWSASWTELTKYDQGDGHEIAYTVSEDAVAGYATTISGSAADGFTVTNTKKEVSATLQVTKAFSNHKWYGQSYDFDLTAKTDGAPLPTSPNGTRATVTAADTPASFGSITFTEPGTYEYYITEVVPEGAVNGVLYGVTYDTAQHVAKVVVSDDGQGQLRVDSLTYDGSDQIASATITNTYSAARTSVQLEATKLYNAWQQGQTFSFVLATDDARNAEGVTSPMPAQTTGTAAEGLNAVFGRINFLAAGVYHYTISEVVPEGAVNGVKDGIAYDTTAHRVTVTVVDNALGQLVPTVTYEGEMPGATSASFTNVYSSKATEATITGHKVVTGQGETRDLSGFEFTLTEVTAPDASGTPVENGTTLAATSGADGSFSFGPIGYEAAGTHYYQVVESQSKPGYSSNDGAKHVTVTVTDDGKGQLVATVTGDDLALTFTNNYSATGSVALGGTKALEGGQLREGQFQFQLAEGSTVLQAVSNKADGTFSFAPIQYTQADAGVHTYTIRELVPAGDAKDPNVTYDTTAYTVTVTVTDDGQGHMLTQVSGLPEGGLSFTNHEAKSATVRLQAAKTVNGQVPSEPFANRFEFQLLDEAGNVLGTATNGEGGIAAFDAITYDSVGTYRYTIREVVPEGAVNGVKDGFTYDGHVVRVVVDVVNEDGQLVATPHYTYESEDGTYAVADANTFENAYAATGTYVPQGTKALTGRTMAEGEFTFSVYEGTTKVSGGTSKADGTIEFQPISYTLADVGDHTYTITEDAGSLGGVAYDGAVKTIVVRVADAGDGTLATTLVAEESQDVAFANTYTAAATGFSVSGTKKLEGKQLEAGQFEFQLTDAQGNVVGSAKNDPEGAFAITTADDLLGAVGDYTYTLAEAGAGQTADGVTFDATTYQLTVHVADDGQGQLYVAGIDGLPEGGAAFANTYKAAGTQATLSVTKAYNAWQEGQSFGFALAAQTEGAPMPEATQATATKDAAATFGAISYDAVGEWDYTITEDLPEGVDAQHPTLDGITYDTTAHKVHVSVADDGKGQLVATVTYDDGQPELTVTNTYRAAATGFRVSGTKTLDGKAPAAGAFEFQLTDKAGDVVGTAANAADGSFAITTADGLLTEPGTYVYELGEVNGGQTVDGIAYDGHVATVTVTVEDDGQGQLVATVDADKDATSFVNTTVPHDKPKRDRLVNTGDPTSLMPAMASATAGLGMIATALHRSRRRKDRK